MLRREHHSLILSTRLGTSWQLSRVPFFFFFSTCLKWLEVMMGFLSQLEKYSHAQEGEKNAYRFLRHIEWDGSYLYMGIINTNPYNFPKDPQVKTGDSRVRYCVGAWRTVTKVITAVKCINKWEITNDFELPPSLH